MKPMILKGPIIPVDVDETLVTWEGTEYTPMKRNIESLIRHAVRGHKIIVWSKGGWKWALRIVKELGLEQYVYQVCDKPWFYLDDKPADTWMERYWYDDRKEKHGEDKTINTDHPGLLAPASTTIPVCTISNGGSAIVHLPAKNAVEKLRRLFSSRRRAAEDKHRTRQSGKGK